MTTPTGSSLVFGLGLEYALGIPGVQLTAYDPGLPADGGVVPSESASGQINSSGFLRKGIPGPKSGTFEWRHPLTMAHLLEHLHNLFGSVTKTEPETGVFQYEFVPRLVTGRVDSSFWGLVGKEPTERRIVHGIRWSQIAMAIADNVEIPVVLTGLPMHGTLVGLAEADGGNTGSYALGPHIRGLLRWPELGPVHIDVTQDVAGGGIEFQVHQTDGSPTYPGTALAALYDSDGNGRWQNLHGPIKLPGTVSVSAGTAAVTGTGCRFEKYLSAGVVVVIDGEQIAVASIADDDNLTLAANHTAGASGAAIDALNRDIGLWLENKDPVEIVFPGDAAAHGDIDVGDEWSFAVPGAWSVPAMASIGASPRFTSAHWVVRVRVVGDSAWTEKDVETGNIGWAWSLEARRGNKSRYPWGQSRTGQIVPSVQLVRAFVDRFFADKFDRHERVELQLEFEGQRIGSGAYREGLLLEMPSAGITGAGQPVANEGTILETTDIRGETDDAGADPCTVTITTTRDWTPPT